MPRSGDRLRAKYRGRALPGSGLYVDLATALEIVRDCEAHDLAVLGLEGFYGDREPLQATTELVRDYGNVPADTWGSFRKTANELAMKFLMAQDPREPKVFDFCFWTSEDWGRNRRRRHP